MSYVVFVSKIKPCTLCFVLQTLSHARGHFYLWGHFPIDNRGGFYLWWLISAFPFSTSSIVVLVVFWDCGWVTYSVSSCIPGLNVGNTIWEFCCAFWCLVYPLCYFGGLNSVLLVPCVALSLSLEVLWWVFLLSVCLAVGVKVQVSIHTQISSFWRCLLRFVKSQFVLLPH